MDIGTKEKVPRSIILLLGGVYINLCFGVDCIFSVDVVGSVVLPYCCVFWYSFFFKCCLIISASKPRLKKTASQKEREKARKAEEKREKKAKKEEEREEKKRKKKEGELGWGVRL